MPSFVIDASATLPWHFEHGATPWAETLLDYLTPCDAPHLQLAQHAGVPLTTLDGDLRKAAQAKDSALEG